MKTQAINNNYRFKHQSFKGDVVNGYALKGKDTGVFGFSFDPAHPHGDSLTFAEALAKDLGIKPELSFDFPQEIFSKKTHEGHEPDCIFDSATSILKVSTDKLGVKLNIQTDNKFFELPLSISNKQFKNTALVIKHFLERLVIDSNSAWNFEAGANILKKLS